MNSPACLRLISQISAFKIIAVVSSHNKKTNAFISESSFIHEFDSLVDFFQDCNLLSNFFAIFSNGPGRNVITSNSVPICNLFQGSRYFGFVGSNFDGLAALLPQPSIGLARASI
jgi:hypothetical protein